jgi:hypothetical protein
MANTLHTVDIGLIVNGDHLPKPENKLVVPKTEYHLSDEEINVIEEIICSSDNLTETGYDGLVSIIIPGDCVLAGLARTIEQRTFEPEGYDSAVDMADYESGSGFIYTVRPNTNQSQPYGVAHLKRFVVPFSFEDITTKGRTRIEVIDDRLLTPFKAQRLELSEIPMALGISAIDTCLNINSNINTRRLPKPTDGKLSPSQISYLSVFKIAEMFGIDHVLSYMNVKALKSLASSGLDAVVFDNFHLPIDDERTKFDQNYPLVRVSRTKHNMQTLESIIGYLGDTPTYQVH